MQYYADLLRIFQIPIINSRCIWPLTFDYFFQESTQHEGVIEGLTWDCSSEFDATSDQVSYQMKKSFSVLLINYLIFVPGIKHSRFALKHHVLFYTVSFIINLVI